MRARDNPFRAERVDGLRFESIGWSYAALLDRLSQPRFRGAIVGSHGVGKTMLFDRLDRDLSAQGAAALRLRLDDSRREVSDEAAQSIDRQTSQTIVLLDGAEQMRPRPWRRFQSRVGDRGLLITSHVGGLLPTLAECRTNGSLLDSLLSQLLDAPTHAAIRDRAAHLFARHAGNLRLVFHDLYDDFAERRNGGVLARRAALIL